MLILAGSINLLDVNPGLAIWTLITFTLVLFVLWRFAWKPIIKALDDRNQKVADDLEKSKELRQKAEALLADYEKKIDSAKEEALEIIDEGRKDAEQLRQRILDEAKEEADKIRNRIGNEIEQAKLKALDELESRVVDLSVQVISNVMRKDISNSEHKDIISKELESLRSNN